MGACFKKHATHKKDSTLKAKSKRPNEKQLTKAIIDLLRSLNWYVIRTHTPGQYAPHKGVSDLIAVGSETVAFIEIKGPRGKVTAEQELFLIEMQLLGWKAFIASSIEDVIENLNLKVLL